MTDDILKDIFCPSIFFQPPTSFLTEEEFFRSLTRDQVLNLHRICETDFEMFGYGDTLKKYLSWAKKK